MFKNLIQYPNHLSTSCILTESNCLKFAICLIFITQLAVKSWIIAKPLEFSYLKKKMDIYKFRCGKVSRSYKSSGYFCNTLYNLNNLSWYWFMIQNMLYNYLNHLIARTTLYFMIINEIWIKFTLSHIDQHKSQLKIKITKKLIISTYL